MGFANLKSLNLKSEIDWPGPLQQESTLKLSVVVPAYNEGERLRGVLGVLQQCASVDEIIVVSDGSTDNTCEVARSYDGVTVIQLPHNLGKGGAMVAGAQRATSDVIAFLDADLIGLTPPHFEALAAPVLAGETEMTIGIFKGGRPRTDWAQVISPFISGQRVLSREFFLSVPDLEETRYGVEIAITGHAKAVGLDIRTVTLMGMTHPMKEEKIGYIRGTISRAAMYWDIVKMMCRVQKKSRVERRKIKVES